MRSGTLTQLPVSLFFNPFSLQKQTYRVNSNQVTQPPHREVNRPHPSLWDLEDSLATPTGSPAPCAPPPPSIGARARGRGRSFRPWRFLAPLTETDTPTPRLHLFPASPSSTPWTGPGPPKSERRDSGGPRGPTPSPPRKPRISSSHPIHPEGSSFFPRDPTVLGVEGPDLRCQPHPPPWGAGR